MHHQKIVNEENVAGEISLNSSNLSLVLKFFL